jgi:shikimate kinase
MGSGKTTIGKQLARAMELPFIDLDEAVSAGESRSIETIFSMEGEVAFRGLERKYLKQITDSLPSFVLSTGGGTPCFYDNMMYMKKHGVTVYLQMDVVTLVHRLVNSTTERPLLKGKGELELHDFVKRHLEERKEFYEESDVVFPAIGFNKVKLSRLLQLLSTIS